jgi:hypothetical protein
MVTLLCVNNLSAAFTGAMMARKMRERRDMILNEHKTYAGAI